MELTLFPCIILAILAFFFLGKHYPGIRTGYIVATGIVLCAYTLWRLFFTLSLESVSSAVFSVLFFLAELFGAFFALFFIIFFFPGRRKTPRPPQPDPAYQPTVDILISTYDEPVKLVLASALAAASLPYENKKVFICDDGKRPLLKEAAERFGIGYFTRPDNAHAKAGNINHALSVTSGELFMLLDADFIVKPRMILEALPHFQDAGVAMVQYPQSFYNKDPFQLLSRRFFNEQDFFMRYIEPRLARHNALIHVGTNALLRRSAVEAIGGIPTKSITEDMTTGMLLQSAGYQTVYLNKAYALGIAPLNLADLKSQRQRWAKGTVQAFRSYSPLRLKGLNRRQKTIYLEMLLYWFSSFQKLVYILMPTLFLLFGTVIMRVTAAQVLLFMAPVLLMFSLNFRMLIGKARTFTSSHIYDTLMAPYHASAILEEWVRPEKRFKVTPKDALTPGKTDWRPVVPHIVLGVWLLAALAIGAWRVAAGAPWWGMAVCAAWTVFNLYGIIYSILAAKKRAAITAGEALSITVDEELDYGGLALTARQMSFDGIRVEKPRDARVPFEPGKTYILKALRTSNVYEAEYQGESGCTLEFAYKNVTREQAYRLNRYYVEKLHAAKALDFDRENLAERV